MHVVLDEKNQLLVEHYVVLWPLFWPPPCLSVPNYGLPQIHCDGHPLLKVLCSACLLLLCTANIRTSNLVFIIAYSNADPFMLWIWCWYFKYICSPCCSKKKEIILESMTFKYHLDHQVCSIYVRSIYSSDNPYHINVSVRELVLFLCQLCQLAW